MALSYRSSATQGGSSGGAITVSKPSGAIDGDIVQVIAYLEPDTNSWSGIGAGFTLVRSQVRTGIFRLDVWEKRLSGDGASWTWTPTTGGNWRTVAAVAYSGNTGTGSPIDVVHSEQAGGVTAIEIDSVTTTATNDLLAAAGNYGSQTAVLSGAVTSERLDFDTLVVGDSLKAAAGATGTTTATYASGNDIAAMHIALREADASGGGPTAKTGTDTGAIGAIGATPALLRASVPTESGALSATEAAAIARATTSTDTGALGASEAAQLARSSTASDTGAVGASEAAALARSSMASSEKNTIRFAVGTPNEWRSAIWKLWVQGNEIYLAAYQPNGKIWNKYSLHSSGVWRLAVDSKYDVVLPETTDRVMQRWARPAEYLPGWCQGPAIVIPHIPLRRPFKRESVGKKVMWKRELRLSAEQIHHFHEMLEMERPSYNGPAEDVLATSLLYARHDANGMPFVEDVCLGREHITLDDTAKAQKEPVA